MALRTIKDHILSVGGRADCVSITPELVTSAAPARQHYQQYLDELKQKAVNQSEKIKAVLDELDHLKAKKKLMQESHDALIKSADQGTSGYSLDFGQSKPGYAMYARV